VPVEVIVNGYPAGTKAITADGSKQPLSFDVDVKEASWIAVRLLPSAPTTPIGGGVGDKPVRASKRSAKWCVDAVETCWNAKKGQIREPERAAARKAYDEAKAIYEKALGEA